MDESTSCQQQGEAVLVVKGGQSVTQFNCQSIRTRGGRHLSLEKSVNGPRHSSGMGKSRDRIGTGINLTCFVSWNDSTSGPSLYERQSRRGHSSSRKRLGY